METSSELKHLRIRATFGLYGRRISITDETVPRVFEHGKGFLDTDVPALGSTTWKANKTIVKVGNVRIGGRTPIVIAGPCSVESLDQLRETAISVKESGAAILRGGAFNPRTSPNSFQGLGEKGLEMLKKVGEEVGMPVVTEILSEVDIPIFERAGIDVAQIGARNGQNYRLIKEVAKSGIPMLLKRGPGSTVDEWLFAAEYALQEGNGSVMLCERGIRTFEKIESRYKFDLDGMKNAISRTHLPVGADPSHSAGRNELVPRFALDALSSGAKFLIIEVHRNPKEALSDAKQQLDLMQFRKLMESIKSHDRV